VRYGVPYRGSKNKIAQWVISNLPAGDTMIDLFAGGCAVTHAALLSGKWNHIVANDIGDGPQLFMDAVHGKYANEKRWISREDFHKLKDSDPYVSLCWSFGNNRRDYLYSKEIEPWKKALHYARVFGDTSLLREFGINSDGSSKDIKSNNKEYKRLYSQWLGSRVKHKRLYDLEHLERLQNLERLQRDYRDVQIPSNSVVYADPPYKRTNCTGYKCDFDHESFEKWLAETPFMVVISEYEAPSGCKEVASIKKQSSMGTGNKGGSGIENLFVQERFAERYKNSVT
jgi:site-specific DNA-adenine methylase